MSALLVFQILICQYLHSYCKYCWKLCQLHSIKCHPAFKKLVWHNSSKPFIYLGWTQKLILISNALTCLCRKLRCLLEGYKTMNYLLFLVFQGGVGWGCCFFGFLVDFLVHCLLVCSAEQHQLPPKCSALAAQALWTLFIMNCAIILLPLAEYDCPDDYFLHTSKTWLWFLLKCLHLWKQPQAKFTY